MKLKYIFLSLICVGLFACSSDDNANSDIVDSANSPDYLSINTDKSWTYHNRFQTEGQQRTQNAEILTANSTTQVDNHTANTFASSVAAKKRGLITAALADGSLFFNDGKLIYNGSFIFSLEADIDLEGFLIPINNMTIFDLNTNPGEQLFSISDTVERTINFTETEFIGHTSLYTENRTRKLFR